MNMHCRVWGSMSEHSVQLQSAFVLHGRNYRETSVIVDLLTRDFGKLSLLAKGVRKSRSRTAGLLQPFVPLLVSYVGKAELKTLTQVEMAPPAIFLQGMALYCGLYVNELVDAFLHKHDPHPEVFDDFRQCLQELSVNTSLEQILRSFEVRLLENIGYGLQLLHEVDCDAPIHAGMRYRYTPGLGPQLQTDGAFSGATLIALRGGALESTQMRAEAKKLLRSVLDYHLAGKPLKSRQLLAQLVKNRQRTDC